jgi:hypothetical protein
MSNMNVSSSGVQKMIPMESVPVKSDPLTSVAKIIPSSESFQDQKPLAPDLAGDITQQMIASLIDSHSIDPSLKVPQPIELEEIAQLREGLGVHAHGLLQKLTQSKTENDLQDLLFNPDKHGAFTGFLLREKVSESIAFLYDFKSVLETKPVDAKSLLALYKEFMAPDAPQRIKLTDDGYKNLNIAFKGMLKARFKGSETDQLKAMNQMLTEISYAGNDITGLLSGDTRERFLSSDHDAPHSEDFDADAYLSFTVDLRTESAQRGYTEVGSLSRFTELSGKLDTAFFKGLQNIIEDPNPETRKTLTEELLEQFQFKRAQDELQDFFMDHILRYAADDREEREELSAKKLEDPDF